MSADDDARIKHIGELLDALKDPALTADELARLESELDQLAQVRDPDAVGFVLSEAPEAIASAMFADRLRTRQGTIMPDFEALHRRKAELDSRFFDADSDDNT